MTLDLKNVDIFFCKYTYFDDKKKLKTKNLKIRALYYDQDTPLVILNFEDITIQDTAEKSKFQFEENKNLLVRSMEILYKNYSEMLRENDIDCNNLRVN